jgi:hypothetical protein
VAQDNIGFAPFEHRSPRLDLVEGHIEFVTPAAIMGLCSPVIPPR